MADFDKTIKVYEATAVLYGEAMEEGDFDQACFCLEKNERAFRNLRSVGKQGEQTLFGLFNHPNPFVRISAATHLLGSYKAQSIQVLEQLADKQGFQGFNARMVLDDYIKGDMVVHKFDISL